MTKRRIKSRTHRFNAIIAIFAAVELNANLLQPLLPVDVFQVLTFVLLVGNAVFRELTKTAIGKDEAV